MLHWTEKKWIIIFCTVWVWERCEIYFAGFRDVCCFKKIIITTHIYSILYKIMKQKDKLY
jgi:hypothetical protein